MALHAVVLGGGVLTAEDPLYDSAPEGHRSLIPIGKKPMAQWVMDALSNSEAVQSITVMGLTPECGLQSPKPLDFLPDGGDLFDNIKVGVLHAAKLLPEQDKVILASSDIPAIQSEMVDWLADQIPQNPEALIYYNVIQKETMEQRFPQAGRSYVRFKDVSVCGGDLNLIDKRLFTVERPIWKDLAENRKHPLRQAGLLGLDNLLLVALHLVTLDAAVKRICKRLDLKAAALRCPYAEMAMDADKPHQLEILRHDLESRQ
ncbi:MAG: NTP transferase domain-containing protein [Anaerolineaceae bacterium]|nr:NTP transferase domain-containing protein [Anaerolineaceae bacterium]